MKPNLQHSKEYFIQLANQFEKEYFENHPELALHWGRKDAALDRFKDNSIAGYRSWEKREDHFLQLLNQIDINDLKDSAEYITYQLLKHTLESNQSARICKEELWNVNPIRGWHNRLTMIAEKQPIGSTEYRQLALKRWQTLDIIVNNEIDNLRIGMQQGYTAPKPAVTRVLSQLKILIHSPTENSPFFAFAKIDSDEEFKKQMRNIITKIIVPAMKRYADFLETSYLPKARDEIGISALSSGSECYAAKIKQLTTLTVMPDAIHQFGLQHMVQLKKEVENIGLPTFGKHKMNHIFDEAKLHAQGVFHSEEDILNYNQLALQRAKSKIADWFDMIPTTPATIQPYPLHQAQTGAPGEYHPPSADGKRPGIFYINTYQPAQQNRIAQEATLFHELIPGHHFQVTLANENKALHSLNKYIWNAGFVEGWALYTERLADEMALYQDDISRLGMLSNEALRTARCVVDTGIHVFNWTRDEAIAYLKIHTAMDDYIIESEVDRYIMMPGQAVSYMLGKREIDTLRQFAKNALGENFDIKQFHNEVLKNGFVTLPMLNAHIKKWVATTCNTNLKLNVTEQK